MPATHRLRLDSAEIGLLDEDPDVQRLLLEIGWGIAGDAAARARKRTGEGAASIQPWPGRSPAGPHVDVSWDQDHFYMSFHEFGTVEISRRPALGPALDRYIHL